MAPASRTESVGVDIPETNPREYLLLLEDKLRDDPCAFEFFQAVRLLERLRPDASPVGRFALIEREVARFGVHNSLSFPASSIQAIEWAEGGQPQMLVNFMGLTGPSGVLPHAYTELIQRRVQAKDRSLAAFLDIFNHRFISLFYRAWEKYRFLVDCERERYSRISTYLASLIGVSTKGLRDRQNAADESLFFYTGLLSLQPRSAAGLRSLLADYFDVPVEIEQFVGAWRPLEADDQCSFADTETDSEKLGLGAVVGDEVWDQESRVRIHLGPLSREQYEQFLPGGSAHEPLSALTRFFAGNDLEFEVQLILRRDEVPACEVGLEGEESPRLGWVTWVKSAPVFGRDPSDTIIPLT